MTALAPNDLQVTALNILVVDGDSSICALYDEVLRAEGYKVATATTRASALSAIERLEGSVDVLVVDVSLSDTECTDLTHEIVGKIGPRPTLYVTEWAEEFQNLTNAPGRWLVMQVPVEIPRFVAAIEWLAGRRTQPPGSD